MNVVPSFRRVVVCIRVRINRVRLCNEEQRAKERGIDGFECIPVGIWQLVVANRNCQFFNSQFVDTFYQPGLAFI